jgi:hypothetical protein
MASVTTKTPAASNDTPLTGILKIAAIVTLCVVSFVLVRFDDHLRRVDEEHRRIMQNCMDRATQGYTPESEMACYRELGRRAG